MENNICDICKKKGVSICFNCCDSMCKECLEKHGKILKNNPVIATSTESAEKHEIYRLDTVTHKTNEHCNASLFKKCIKCNKNPWTDINDLKCNDCTPERLFSKSRMCSICKNFQPITKFTLFKNSNVSVCDECVYTNSKDEERERGSCIDCGAQLSSSIVEKILCYNCDFKRYNRRESRKKKFCGDCGNLISRENMVLKKDGTGFLCNDCYQTPYLINNSELEKSSGECSLCKRIAKNRFVCKKCNEHFCIQCIFEDLCIVCYYD